MQKFCAKCGMPANDSAAFCRRCGEPLNRQYRARTLADSIVWYIEHNGQAIEITQGDLCEKIRNGSISSNTLVVNNEIKQWIPLKQTQLYITNAPFFENPKQNVSYYIQDNSSATPTIGIIALVLAVISLFVFPYILGAMSFVLSIVSMSVEKKDGYAAAAIIITIISVFLAIAMHQAILMMLFK